MRYLRKTTASCASLCTHQWFSMACMCVCVCNVHSHIHTKRQNASKSRYLHNKLNRLDIWAFLFLCVCVFFALLPIHSFCTHISHFLKSVTICALLLLFLTSIFAVIYIVLTTRNENIQHKRRRHQWILNLNISGLFTERLFCVNFLFCLLFS